MREMDCNKDEASKAKELAEKKFEEKDIVGAKKLALKAQHLFPSLDGLPEFIAALDIYISADRKINGEVDWYGVIGVDPSVDVETVRKQYRKLALILHPDKNKSVGADGAFKLLSEAWRLLADKDKRMAYDQKRKQGLMQHKFTRVDLSAAAACKNEFRPPANFTLSSRNQKKTSRCFAAPPPSCPVETDRFWTTCTRCKMQYEYLKVFLNQKLVCPSCHDHFVAIQVAPPLNMDHQTWSFCPQKQASSLHTGKGSSFTHGGDSTSSPAQTTFEAEQVSVTIPDALKDKTNAFKRNYGVQVKGERLKKSGSPNVKAMKGNMTKMSSSAPGSFKRGSVEAVNLCDHSMRWPNVTGEPSLSETRNVLLQKAKIEICKDQDECTKSASLKAASEDIIAKETEMLNSVAEQVPKTMVDSNSKAVGNGLESEGNEHGGSVDAEHHNESKTSTPTIVMIDSQPLIDSIDADDTEYDDSLPLQLDIPDPEFYNFDKDRGENSVDDNQVWAAYDDDDGMPRKYVMVHGVMSRKPFRMRISWLNSKSNVEFGRTNWVGGGFTKTSGNFRKGKQETSKSIISFSHEMKWTKGTRGGIQIYPQKGEVWALYRNWSSDWNKLTPKKLIHRYNIVEVLDDYDEKKGVIVVPLVKVPGFKVVFRRHSDPQQARVIPREQMFRFSHQVPSCLLTGEESPKAPAGCRELDPAATPLGLLHAGAKQTSMANVGELTGENISGGKRKGGEEATGNGGPAKKPRKIEE